MRFNEQEVELKAIRSSGPGGQNVNKVATAIQLKFDSQASSLSAELKTALLKLNDSRISTTGIITITARQHRTQEANRQAALDRLDQILEQAAYKPKRRRPTRPTRASVKKRLDSKRKRSLTKRHRGQVHPDKDS